MTSKIVAGNYAYGTLNTPITAGSTSITFTTSAGTSFPVLSKTVSHPQQYFYLTLVDALTQGVTTREIVKVTGPSAATTGVITYTITRAQEGTTAHAFAAGDGVQLRWTQQTGFDYAAQGTPIGWFNVLDFGAKGDGVTNDTVAFQDAIDAAANNRGGFVHVPPGYNYYFTGTLNLKDNVHIGSTIMGSTGAWTAAGGTTPAGATLSITNLSTTFIYISGRNCGISGLIFYYPNQVLQTATAPVAYPYTITSPVGDTTIQDCTLMNPTHGISLLNGSQWLKNLRIGAYNVGISMDQGVESQTLRDIQIGAGLMDGWFGYTFPQNMDIYTSNNLVCIDIRRSDSFSITNLITFYSKVGIQMIDSVTISPSACYGTMEHIDLEAPIYGLICQCTTSGLAAGGVKISNLNILGSPQPGPFAPSVNAIWMKSGGSVPPYLQIFNGFMGNTYSGNIIQYDAGVLEMRQVYNADYPSTVVTSPAVPASTVNATNPYPYPVTVYIAGGTYTDVKVMGTLVGFAATTVALPANGTIAVTYTAAPTWKWINGC